MNTFDILKNELKNKVKGEVKLESDLRKLGIDSIELLDLIVEIEEKFKISINDEELLKLKKIEDIVKLIDKKRK